MATFGPSFPILAQAGESGVLDMLWAIVLVLLGIGLLIGVIAFVRKRFTDDGTNGTGEAFTLGSLRQLVKEGKMTQEEFDKAKEGIIAAHHKAVAREATKRALAREQLLEKEAGNTYVPPPPPV